MSVTSPRGVQHALRGGGIQGSPPLGAQDRKLHQLPVPTRPTLNQVFDPDGQTTAVGGVMPLGPSATSWDDREVARQIAMLTEERDFLRKYVSRCEHELKAYQLQYPDLVGGHTAAGNGDLLNELSGGIEELPPWIGQAKYMSPLLVAYESRIEELMEKNQEQLHDFATLKHQYDDLYKRNTEAEAELESNIKNLLTHMDQQKGGGGVGRSALLDEDEVNELQEQVNLYKEQLDIVNSQKLELEQELAKAHKQIAEVRAERDQYWSGEIKKHQNALAQLRLERDKFKNSSSTLTQSQFDLAALQKEHTNLQKKFLSTQVQLEQTEKELDESNEKEKAASGNLLNAERDLESLLKTLQNMEADMEAMKRKEVDSIKKEGELLTKTEAMKLEKDQALLRESSLRADVARLEEKLAFELQAAHRKHDSDLAELYSKSKEQEEKLNHELANLSLLLTESDVTKDKAIRDMKQSKQESEQILQGIHSDMTSLKTELNHQIQRQQELQQSQEQAETKLKRSEAELVRAQDFYTKEKLQSGETIAALKLKNDTLTQANQNATVQNGRLSENLLRLQKDYTELKRLSEQSITRLQSQLLELETQRKSQVDELKLRLDEAYRMHERSEARANELTAQQDLLCEKWREENKMIRGQLSKLLTDEKNLTASLHARIAEFEARVGQLVRERDQAMTFQGQYEQLKKSHELSTSDLTQRVQLLTNELNSYATREPEYHLIQKQLQSRLDRSEIEVKRLTRQYEAARKKVDFLETQQAGIPNTNTIQPLQPLANNQQSQQPTNGRTSYLQPIPFAASLLPPAKKL